jgi:hypothetical protein
MFRNTIPWRDYALWVGLGLVVIGAVVLSLLLNRASAEPIGYLLAIAAWGSGALMMRTAIVRHQRRVDMEQAMRAALANPRAAAPRQNEAGAGADHPGQPERAHPGDRDRQR